MDEVGSSLKDVVDKAIEIGVVSDDSAESVAKVVDILTDMGLTGSVSIDNLTKSFTEAQDSINKTTSNMESLKSILSESVSGAGMSADSVKAFKDMFGDDADKALEKTANGYHLNQKALAQLQKQQSRALDCRDAIVDLKEQESKLIEQRFNNIKDEYDAILKQFEHTQSMLEGAIDITETSGYIVSTKYYDSLISNENEKINKLYAEREALVNSLNSALNSGKIDKYSESWYNMQDEL